MNSLPDEIERKFLDMLQNMTGRGSEIKSVKNVSGGSINTACKVTVASGRSFFLKYNLNDRYPGMFVAESKGLKTLRETGTVRIPKVLWDGVADQYSFLVLEMIDPGRQRVDFFETLGQQLAALHLVTDDQFGLDHDNYIGSLHQPNEKKESFDVFFRDMRLMPLARMAYDAGSLPQNALRQLDQLCDRISEFIPSEKPALLHGDLWSGNRITGPEGDPWLIDPAVNFGHRETDIAMTRLFGGFDGSFYEAYHGSFPLQPGWEERLDLHNLYPLLVHLNLFGSGYLPQIEQILRRYS